MQQNITLPVARLDNTFVYNARYQFSAREAKVVLYLISKIDPVKQKRLHEQTIPVKELEAILKEDGKKWGGLYKELDKLGDRLMNKPILMPTDIKIGGKPFPNKLNWFQGISPVRMEDGSVGLRFLFSELLQPVLLNLQRYVGVKMLEVLPLKSGFSVRMFQVFRAHRNQMAKYQKKSTLRYDIPELKSILGVDGKYDDFGNFKKRVLKPMQEEISKYTSIKVKWRGIRKGRCIEEVEFNFWDKGGNQSNNPNQGQLFQGIRFEELSYAQMKAFDRLVAYGVMDDVVLEMLGKTKSSEIIGFEDWYFEEVIRIFEAKTSQETQDAKAGTLVVWYLKMKIFEQGDHFSSIMEQLQLRKKQLQDKNPVAWDNRLRAKDMTANEFYELAKGGERQNGRKIRAEKIAVNQAG